MAVKLGKDKQPQVAGGRKQTKAEVGGMKEIKTGAGGKKKTKEDMTATDRRRKTRKKIRTAA
eukprot:9185253-Prorocentrum_lima.AAC.1